MSSDVGGGAYSVGGQEITLLGDQMEEFNPRNFTYFVKPTYYDMSNLRLEGLKKTAEIVQWGRRNPVKFCERFFGIEFLDYQKYVFMQSWITPNVVWCMGRSSGKTTLGSPFLMAKTLLIPYFEGYILSGTGAQSIGMMKKIEQIAKRELASFTGLTDIFYNELFKTQSNSNGFSHNPNSWSYKVWSGSGIATVNSNYDAFRGKRSRLNFYDEATYVPEDMYVATMPFTTQNSDFKLGGGIDVSLLPPDFPNQTIFASSAGSVDDYFYKMYKDFSLRSMAGDKRYACFDIDCDIVLNATYNGKVYPKPLITQEKIDDEMKTNPIKANREYRNKFDIDCGDQIIVKKSQILRNSVLRPPELVNVDGKSKYVLAWDLAAKKDNSVLSIGKLVHSDKKGWRMEIVNCINLLDKATKRPLTTPQQIERVREEIINYNGVRSADYENIQCLMMDAGAGGGASQVLTILFDNFYEKGHQNDKEYLHKGMIDKTYSFCEPYIRRYPEALDKIRMVEPTKWKVQMYTQLIELIEQDLITFTAEYDYHGCLSMLTVEDGVEKEEEYRLTHDEEEALKQIDAMKEEVTHMYRYKSSNGNIRYDLAPGFETIIGDDRSYTLALLGKCLWDLRQEDKLRGKSKPKTKELFEMFTVTRPKKVTRY